MYLRLRVFSAISESDMMKIALIGTRGTPANYGGFETCVEEIGRRLAERGHEVTVYCRFSYYDDHSDIYLGMKRVFLPNLQRKTLDTMSHTFLSAWHALFQKYDVCMVFNAANAPFILPLRFSSNRIAINTDGLEWKRSKWGFGGKAFYKFAELFSCLIANRLVSDSRGIKEYYRTKYLTDSSEIAYGAYVEQSQGTDVLTKYGLEPGKYFLQITRFEPENHPLLTIQAFKKLQTDIKLVLVGGNPYPGEYTARIEAEACENVLLPGFIYDKITINELWCNCLGYVHGNCVGGTNPALLQAMASGCFTMAVDVPFNRDVLADCGIYFDNTTGSLAAQMTWCIEHRAKLEGYRNKAKDRIINNYSWDKIVTEYEELFVSLMRNEYPWRFNWKAISKTPKMLSDIVLNLS
jgi:glycosyltransferase involved in cell wall biosynthesis